MIDRMRLPTKLLACVLVVSTYHTPVAAADKKGAEPERPKAPDLGLPSFGAIPKGEGVVAPKETSPLPEATISPASATYSIVHVFHGKAFSRGPGGARPVGGGMAAITVSGKKPATEKFTTVVRIKSPQRVGAAITLQITDPYGGSLMSASGDFTFRGTKGDEVDYTVDWDPTACRAGGDYTLSIRIGDAVVGTYPLKLVEKS